MSKICPPTPSWMVLPPGRAARMGQIRTGPRSTSKRHGITVINLPQSCNTHRLKVCFVLMSSISRLEQPSATPHYAVKLQLMQPVLGTDPSAAAFQGMGIHALVRALLCCDHCAGCTGGGAVQGVKASLSLGL